MFLKAPEFWYKKDTKIEKCLQPIAALYNLINSIGIKTGIKNSVLPIIYVNQIVIGDALCIPAMHMLFKILSKNGFVPSLLANGRGGYLTNVLRVDNKMHTYTQVGNDALLLSEYGETWIGKNNSAVTDAIVLSGANVVVTNKLFGKMTTPSIRFLLVNGMHGFGNEQVFPAGPLREHVRDAVNFCDAVIVVGKEYASIKHHIDSKPCFYVEESYTCSDALEDKNIVAFCSTWQPDTFKHVINSLSLNVIDFIQFSENHKYTITEIKKLINGASRSKAELLTTKRDYVKIHNVFKQHVKFVDTEFLPVGNSMDDFVTKKLSMDGWSRG